MTVFRETLGLCASKLMLDKDLGIYFGYVFVPWQSNMSIDLKRLVCDEFLDPQTKDVVHGGITLFAYNMLGFDCAHGGDALPMRDALMEKWGYGPAVRDVSSKADVRPVVRDECFAKRELRKLLEYAHGQGYHDHPIDSPIYRELASRAAARFGERLPSALEAQQAANEFMTSQSSRPLARRVAVHGLCARRSPGWWERWWMRRRGWYGTFIVCDIVPPAIFATPGWKLHQRAAVPSPRLPCTCIVCRLCVKVCVTAGEHPVVPRGSWWVQECSFLQQQPLEST